MREIKFRLWDASKKQMQEFINHFIYLDGKVASFDENGKISGTVDHENLVPIQYTGLKDKNGKEIYEGDIISAFHGTQKSAVTWNEEYGLYEVVLQVSGLSEPMEELLGNHLDVIEVIDNIYENPELLESKSL